MAVGLRQSNDPPETYTWPADELARFKAYMGEDGFASVVAAEAAPARKGHNQPPRDDPLADKTQKQIFEDCVWLSDEATGMKLFLLCVHRFFDAACRASSMSYGQIARDCSAARETGMRFAKKALGLKPGERCWLQIEIGKGFMSPKGPQNLYHGICPPDLVERLRNGETARPDPSLAEAVDGVMSDHPTPNGVISDHRVMSGHPGQNDGVISHHGVMSDHSRGDVRSPLLVITGDKENNNNRNGHAHDADETRPVGKELAVASAANPIGILAPATPGITEADIDDWSSRLQTAVEIWSPDPFKTRAENLCDRSRDTVLAAIKASRRRDPPPTDAVLAKAMEKALADFARRAKTRKGKWDAALSYFDETLDTMVGKVEAGEIRRRVELVKAQVEVDQTVTLANAGVAAYANRLGSRRNGPTPGIMVGKQIITSSDIQLAMRQVEGATDEEAEAAYREVGRKHHKGNPAKADVVDAAVEHLRAQKLYEQFGKPAEQIDVAKTKRGDAFEARWWAISEAKLGSLLDQYSSTSEYDAWKFFTDLQHEIEKPHERYGRGLQVEVESALAAKLAHHHAGIEAEAKRKREELEAEAERQRQEEEDLLLWKQADEAARSRSGKTGGDWARMSVGERKPLTQVEFNRLKYAKRHAAVRGGPAHDG